MRDTARERCAIYSRCSTDMQEKSVERQLSSTRPYAEKQGYTLVASEQDEGLSGLVVGRGAGFQRVLALAIARKIEVIVVDEPSRLSREDVIDFISNVVAPLRAAGVRVDSASKGPLGWDDLMQQLMLVIGQSQSHQESQNTSRRVLTRALMVAKEGKYVPKIAPYGYRITGEKGSRRLVVGPDDEVRTLRWMFDMVANQGWTAHQVTRELTKRGTRPPTGNRTGAKWKDRNIWDDSTVRKMMRSRVYAGDMVWGKTRQGMFEVRNGEVAAVPREERQRVRCRAAKAEDLIVRENTHDALIERDLFTRTQEALTRNRKQTGPKRGEARYMLTRLLVCHRCGVFMVGKKSRGRRQYTCSTNEHKGAAGCVGGFVWDDEMVEAIVEAIQRDFLNPEALAVLREELLRQAEADRQGGEMEALRARVRELDREIERGTSNLFRVDPENVPLVSKALTQRRKDREHVLGRIAELESAAAEIEEEVEAAEHMLCEFREALTGDDAEKLRAVLHEAVEKVELKLLKNRGRGPSWERGVVWLKRSGGASDLGTSNSSNRPRGGASSRATGCPRASRGPG